MERVCFLLQIKPGMVEEYLTAHEVVWPEMLEALSRTGWHNYSMFIRQSDGLVIGYLETDDYAAAQRAIDAEPINQKWQAVMGPYFELPGGARPDDGSFRLTEYFHLA